MLGFSLEILCAKIAVYAHNPEVMRFKSHPRKNEKTYNHTVVSLFSFVLRLKWRDIYRFICRLFGRLGWMGDLMKKS